MDFVIGLPISANWKGDSYDSILVIVDRLTQMVHYVPVKVTIDAPGLAEVIIDVVVHHHGVPESIVTNRGSLFSSKFWYLLCYFVGINRKLSTAFYPQTDGYTEWQNSMMEAYLRAFVNWKQDDWAKLLPMAEFPTIMPRMLAPVTPHSNSIAATTLESLLKRTLTPARDLALLTS